MQPDSNEQENRIPTLCLPWTSRVSAYLNDLEELANQIKTILDQTHVDTSNINGEEVQRSSHTLQMQLAELETMVAQRQMLLGAEDAPTGPNPSMKSATLGDALRLRSDPLDLSLAKRCDEVGQLIGTTHQRALALFVCQFHLADFTSEMVRILVGAETPPTYARDANSTSAGSGGLFNKAG
ncbi:MAG: hypothetical protein AB8B91_17000 [Rubripirellula sp.]